MACEKPRLRLSDKVMNLYIQLILEPENQETLNLRTFGHFQYIFRIIFVCTQW